MAFLFNVNCMSWGTLTNFTNKKDTKSNCGRHATADNLNSKKPSIGPLATSQSMVWST